MSRITPRRKAGIRKSLLRWFSRNSRRMPWRSTKDPYRILLAEILLQQTRTTAALPYYRNFLKRFPTLGSLARAPLPAVLREWSGLGYYARARNLHSAAGEIRSRHGGRIPDTREELLRLPGIGPYTAAAVLSFVYGKREAVLDGNVARVLSRLFAVRGDPRSGPALHRLRELAAELVPPGGSREHNLAMMDLGSTVCRPRSPRCGECPLVGACRARARNLQGRFPEIPRPRRQERVEQVVAVLRRRGRVLLVPRPEGGLLGGMWELPGCGSRPGGRHAIRLERELTRRWGFPVRTGQKLDTVQHAITYRRITLHAIHACIPPDRRVRVGRWVGARELSRYPITTATRKVLDGLGGERGVGGGGREALP